jgi:protein-S-isoprenylcysteine O-methyltransferase Ste14
MKRDSYNLRTVVVILLCCVLAVLFFPVAFDNPAVYEGIIYTSIAIVILLLLFLIKVHIFESGKHKHIAD